MHTSNRLLPQRSTTRMNVLAGHNFRFLDIYLTHPQSTQQRTGWKRGQESMHFVHDYCSVCLTCLTCMYLLYVVPDGFSVHSSCLLRCFDRLFLSRFPLQPDLDPQQWTVASSIKPSITPPSHITHHPRWHRRDCHSRLAN